MLKRRLEKIETDLYRSEPHGPAPDLAEPLLARHCRLPASGAGEMDEADRFPGRSPVRPGDSRDADCDFSALSA
jgi:hypothetical protein